MTLDAPEIWWFNGEDAANYDESTAATADVGTCPGTVSWLVTAGADKAMIVDPTANPATINSLSKSLAPNDVEITCQLDGVPVCSVPLTVKQPGSMEFIFLEDTNWGNGYKTILHYSILDQFAQQLPEPVELNEKWLGPDVSEYPGGDTWPQPAEQGGMVSPSDAKDNVGATGTFIPSCVNPNPHAPAVDERVQSWPAQIAIGHDGTGLLGDGRGVPVFFPKYRMYRGKGRHEALFDL